MCFQDQSHPPYLRVPPSMPVFSRRLIDRSCCVPGAARPYTRQVLFRGISKRLAPLLTPIPCCGVTQSMM